MVVGKTIKMLVQLATDFGFSKNMQELSEIPMKHLKPSIFPYVSHPGGVPTPGHASNTGVSMAQRRPKPRRLRRTPGGDARVCGH
jgi:hypothetical protein